MIGDMDEKLWDIPESWEWVKVSDLGNVVSGGTPSTKNPEYWNGDVNWISPADLTGYKEKYISSGGKSITEEGLRNSSARLMPKGTVLFSSRAPVGYVAIASSELATNQGFKSIVPGSGLDSEFLYYYLKASKGLAESRASGTTFRELSGKAFSNLPAVVAPAEEQRRIVAKIEELFSELDKGVESLKTARAQLKTYRQSLLKAAFEGRLTQQWRRDNSDKLETAEQLLKRIREERKARYQQQMEEWESAVAEWEANRKSGKRPTKPNFRQDTDMMVYESIASAEVPVGWGKVKLETLCDVVRGGSPRPAGDSRFYGGHIPFLKVADLTKGDDLYLKTFTFTIKEEGLQKTRFVEPNILMLSNSGATLGVPKICTFPTTFNDGIAAFLGLPKQYHEFLYFFFLSRIEMLRAVNQGAAQPNLNTGILKEYMVPVCSYEEMDFISKSLIAKLESCKNIENEIDNALIRSEALRQSILKRAFEGKLVPQDPDDEPASTLLARIRQEQADAPKTKRRKRKTGAPA